MGVSAAGLQEEHADGWIGGEPVREDATRRSRTDDDVVVALSFSHRYAQRANERTGGS
jgi:hypothetical protein